MKRILCYGDSNTWGKIPAAGARYEADVRWTGVASSRLGSEYRIIEDGINGRTTAFDDDCVAYRNGSKGLGYSLCAHAPLDLIVVSLGTNDLRYTGIEDSYKGLDELLGLIENATANFPAAGCEIFPHGVKILVVSPIHLRTDIAVRRPEHNLADKYDESLKFADGFRRVAEAHGACYLDASRYAEPSVWDCVHMDPESHRALGIAIADKIRAIFEGEEQ